MNDQYRRDIDGLRALSVLSVVFFHAFPALVPGGFIGVDVFFVISGFLISGIVFREAAEGTFSFRHFYARRIKRIFPSLLLVIIASLGFGWLALFSDQYRRLGFHAAGSAAFVSNFMFWREAGYFDTTAETKPLLHLWSLAVEEQFYLIWPLCALMAWKWRVVRPVIVTAAAVSFALNLFRIEHSQSEAFYLLYTRFWELLIGAFLSQIPKSSSCLSKTTQNITGGVGLLLIGISIFVISGQSGYPGWRALIPTLGAALFLFSGPGGLFNRALSFPILVGIGLIRVGTHNQ